MSKAQLKTFDKHSRRRKEFFKDKLWINEWKGKKGKNKKKIQLK